MHKKTSNTTLHNKTKQKTVTCINNFKYNTPTFIFMYAFLKLETSILVFLTKTSILVFLKKFISRLFLHSTCQSSPLELTKASARLLYLFNRDTRAAWAYESEIFRHFLLFVCDRGRSWTG